MQGDIRQTGKLQATLEDMKRRLGEEREAAEVLTRHLTAHRDRRGQASSPSRHGALEAQLASAQRQLSEQKSTTEKWIQHVTTERDAGRARLREAEQRIEKLQEQLRSVQASMQASMEEQRTAAELMIQGLS